MIEYDHEEEARYAALVCHPHPMFGGTMHTKAVFHAAKAAALEGVPALRFNFRGVGGSEGKYDEGRGEQNDVRAALNYLSSRYPRVPVLLMGFSFGSAIGLRVGARDARVSALVGMGLPVKSYDYSYLSDCPKPKLFVEGANDPYGPRAQVEELVARVAPPKRLYWVEGADHFFTGKLDEVRETIRAFVRETMPRPNLRQSTGR